MNGWQSIEVRWFYPGNLPEEIATWFNMLGQPISKPDVRTDFYLQSGSADVGVKIRQGNLEVKHLQQQFAKIAIDGFGEGQIEQWSKWICTDQSAHSPVIGKQGWIPVAKVRQQQFYQVKFLDPIQLVSIVTPTENAVAIEITRLQLREQPWWTIACEYLGNNISIDQQFVPLVRSLIINYPLSISTSSISCGYPQWLNASNRHLGGFTD